MAATPEGQSSYKSKLDRILQSTVGRTPLQRSNARRVGPLGSTTLHRPGSCYGLHIRRRPYDETPSTFRSKKSSNAAEQSPMDNNINELRGKTWKIFRVTPLYNFQSKKSDFQHYSRTLSAHIAAEAKKGTFIDSSIPDDAVVNPVTGFNVGINDQKAVLIEVRSKTRNNSLKVTGQALLFSTDLEVNPLKLSLQHEFSYFASMIIRGPIALAETIQNWIEVQFDCRVVPQVFTASELGFVAALCTGMEDNDKPVELVYNLPVDVDGLSNITYSNKQEDCKRLWNAIRSSEEEEEELSYKEASEFIDGLESHFYECFSIRLSAMPLTTVQTAIVFISRQGQIKFLAKSNENILKMLRYLTDIALEHLKSF